MHVIHPLRIRTQTHRLTHFSHLFLHPFAVIVHSSDFDRLLARQQPNSNVNSVASTQIRESILLHFDPLREQCLVADSIDDRPKNNNSSTAAGEQSGADGGGESCAAHADDSASSLMLEPIVDDADDDVANNGNNETTTAVADKVCVPVNRQALQSRNASIESAAGGNVDVEAEADAVAIALAEAEQRAERVTAATEAAQTVSPDRIRGRAQ